MANQFEAKFGVYPVMITPFCEDGSIDYAAVKAIVDWYWENGVRGIFAVCQSSEMFFLSREEKVKLAHTVVSRAYELARENPSRERMQIVVSGHTAETLEEQLEDMKAIAATGPDAIILVSNRFDVANTSDEAWIADAERFIAGMPENMPLGVYECPYPYKRLMSERMLEWCGQTGRFHFMKDTCCDARLIEQRVKQLEKTPFKLMNANGQTLLDTLQHGSWGYSGVMANFFPDLIVRLCDRYQEEPEKAKLIQAFLGVSSFTEFLPYPITAKYYLQQFAGIPMTLQTRSRSVSEFTPYAEDCVKQLALLAENVRRQL